MSSSKEDYSLEAEIEKYGLSYPAESRIVGRFLALLKHPDACLRTHLPGHITGSAFIVSGEHTLLVHHAKLNRWLQPGGHADGDRNVQGVALREANEETGLTSLSFFTPSIFDLDIHTIPARKDFPQHEHYDIRFLLKGTLNEKIVVSAESHDVKWVPLENLEEYNDEPALLRMRDKLKGITRPS